MSGSYGAFLFEALLYLSSEILVFFSILWPLKPYEFESSSNIPLQSSSLGFRTRFPLAFFELDSSLETDFLGSSLVSLGLKMRDKIELFSEGIWVEGGDDSYGGSSLIGLLS